MSSEDPAQKLIHYGSVPIEERVPIAAEACMSLDLRQVTGARGIRDESRMIRPPHPFRLSVYGRTPGEYPTAEIRFMVGEIEFALVGQLTGRQGVNEITPEHLTGAIHDPKYLESLRAYFKVAC